MRRGQRGGAATNRGFTLIEAIIVMGIMALVGGVAMTLFAHAARLSARAVNTAAAERELDRAL